MPSKKIRETIVSFYNAGVSEAKLLSIKILFLSQAIVFVVTIGIYKRKELL